MFMVLQRDDLSDVRTLGGLIVTGTDFSCHTLEDQVRPRGAEKVPGQTAIPAGLYRVVVNWSKRFRRPMPLVEDVPGFSGIRIHSGNFASHTEGCILVGLLRGVDAVYQSKAAFEALLPLILAGEREEGGCWIDVRDRQAPPEGGIGD